MSLTTNRRCIGVMDVMMYNVIMMTVQLIMTSPGMPTWYYYASTLERHASQL